MKHYITRMQSKNRIGQQTVASGLSVCLSVLAALWSVYAGDVNNVTGRSSRVCKQYPRRISSKVYFK